MSLVNVTSEAGVAGAWAMQADAGRRGCGEQQAEQTQTFAADGRAPWTDLLECRRFAPNLHPERAVRAHTYFAVQLCGDDDWPVAISAHGSGGRVEAHGAGADFKVRSESAANTAASVRLASADSDESGERCRAPEGAACVRGAPRRALFPRQLGGVARSLGDRRTASAHVRERACAPLDTNVDRAADRTRPSPKQAATAEAFVAKGAGYRCWRCRNDLGAVGGATSARSRRRRLAPPATKLLAGTEMVARMAPIFDPIPTKFDSADARRRAPSATCATRGGAVVERVAAIE